MDPNQLTSEERAQLHSLFNCIQLQVLSQQTNQSIGTPQPSLQPSSLTVSASDNPTPQFSSMAPLPSTLLTAPVLHQYQRARGIQGTSTPLLPFAPYGHPSSISAGGPSQPFLSLYNISSAWQTRSINNVAPQSLIICLHTSFRHEVVTEGQQSDHQPFLAPYGWRTVCLLRE
jgi:hypothetical protein